MRMVEIRGFEPLTFPMAIGTLYRDRSFSIMIRDFHALISRSR